MQQPSTINMAKTSSPSTLACARLRLGNKRRTSLCMAALLGCEDDGIAFLLVECQIWESIPHLLFSSSSSSPGPLARLFSFPPAFIALLRLLHPNTYPGKAISSYSRVACGDHTL